MPKSQNQDNRNDFKQAVLDGVPPTGVATLKVRKGAFDAFNEGSGAFGKVKLSPPRGRPLKNFMAQVAVQSRNLKSQSPLQNRSRIVSKSVESTLSFLSLVFFSLASILSKEFPWLFLSVSLVFPRF